MILRPFKQARTEAFEVELNELNALEVVHTTFKTLSNWMQYDVLHFAGKPPIERAILYDFIQFILTLINLTHRISPLNHQGCFVHRS
jgi:hypothetical protein